MLVLATIRYIIEILKFGPVWQTKYALAVPKNLGVEVGFGPYGEEDFLTGCPYSVSKVKPGESEFFVQRKLFHCWQIFQSLSTSSSEYTYLSFQN